MTVSYVHSQPSLGLSSVLMAIVVAGLLGFGLGAKLDIPQPEPTETYHTSDQPDWHGNVKRSHP